MGELEAARQHAQACLAVAERLRDRFWLASAFWANEIVCRLSGDFQGALTFNDRGLSLLPGDPRLLGTRALTEFELGDYDAGRSHVEELLEATRLATPGPSCRRWCPEGISG